MDFIASPPFALTLTVPPIIEIYPDEESAPLFEMIPSAPVSVSSAAQVTFRFPPFITTEFLPFTAAPEESTLL